MLYTYMPILYYHSNLHVIERPYAGGRGFLLSQLAFLLNPAHALHGGVSYFEFVCLCVCPLANYLKKY